MAERAVRIPDAVTAAGLASIRRRASRWQIALPPRNGKRGEVVRFEFSPKRYLFKPDVFVGTSSAALLVSVTYCGVEQLPEALRRKGFDIFAWPLQGASIVGDEASKNRETVIKVRFVRKGEWAGIVTGWARALPERASGKLAVKGRSSRDG